MDLLEKSRNTLELPAVLEMLAGEAVSEPAKAEALALVPSVHRAEVERLLAETSDAKDMMVYKGSPSLSGLRDVRGSLARADMGGVLNTRELLEIAGVLQSARAVRSYGMSTEKETCIDHLFKMLQTNRFLEDKIVNSIPGEDEIADSASSELADIRRKMRAAAARVAHLLERRNRTAGHDFAGFRIYNGFKALAIVAVILIHIHHQPFRKRVYHRRAYAVQAARIGVILI